MMGSVLSYAQRIALRVNFAQAQPCGQGLLARSPASSPGRVRTYASSLFLAIPANRHRREAWRI